MATTMKDLMGLRRWALLAAGVTVMVALVLSLGATKAFADEWIGDDPYVEPSRPYVTQVNPQDGATGVSRMTNVEVTFSQAMNPYSFNGATFKLYDTASLQQIPATVSKVPDPNQQTFKLDPYGSDPGRLDPNKKYRVVVTTDVEDYSGNNMSSEKVWYFTTAPASAPSVTQVSPPDGATGVARSTNIKVTFSEPMDPASINTSTLQLRYYDVLCTSRYPDPYNPCYFSMYQITATVSKDAADPSGRTWVIDPEGLLYANKNYMVRVTTGVKDIEDGLQMSTNKEWRFKTGSY